jgi:hypothetical protein
LEENSEISTSNLGMDLPYNQKWKNKYLWWDSWHPEGPLMEKHNRRIIIHETGIPSDAKVPSVIKNKFVGYSVLMELRMIRRLEN